MTLHILKLAVGVEDVEHLKARQIAFMGSGPLYHRTRMTPRREKKVLDGGSLYWVIRKVIRVRQPILALRKELDEEGHPFCLIQLAPEWTEVEPRRHRAFQGWRYLTPEEAPPDLPPGVHGEEPPPPEMAAELKELGLL